MSSEALPPPTYYQQDPQRAHPLTEDGAEPLTPAKDLQIIIIPATAINFQKGYLGAEGERAAIEGELQIKELRPRVWGSITIALRTTEKAYEREIELGSCELQLFQATTAETRLPSSTFPFSIPLMEDTPQTLHTPSSSLSHTLIATLRPYDISEPPITETLEVHTKRYTSHAYTPTVSPEVHSLDDPARIQVQIPRSTFKAGEAVPIYVTIPPPPRELVVDRGIRLRNVRVELVRVVKVKRHADDDLNFSEGDEDTTDKLASEIEDLSLDQAADGPSTARPQGLTDKSAAKATNSSAFSGSTYRTIIARSGASCRFHSSRSIQLRFVLHQHAPGLSSPMVDFDGLRNAPDESLDDNEECPAISQTTLLNSITFRLHVHIAFVDTSSRTERIATLKVPLEIVPPPAPLPEIDESMGIAYQKKHDRPPTRTVRYEDADPLIPEYAEGQAGPSALPHGAPPPFEERDAPPPFFSSAAEASSSTRLPTFLEAESEIFIPPSDDQHGHEDMDASDWLHIEGEGIEFGFMASQQFDGHAEEMLGSSTPPPTLEMSGHDTDLTELTDITEPQHAIEALGRALEQHDQGRTAGLEPPPPPPPAMDDPSDPPPSIDSDFRSPASRRQSSPPRHPASPSPEPTRRLHSPPLATQPTNIARNAPPPYLNAESQPGHDHEQHVARPPPYVDF